MRPEFKEKLALRMLSLLKWPIIIFALYLAFPSSLVHELSNFIQTNNIKKLEANTNGFSFEVSDEKSVQNIKNAQELTRLASELAALKQSDQPKTKNILNEVKNKSENIIQTSLAAFSKNGNRNYVVGNVLNSIAEFQYKIERNGVTDIVLKVFIDKFPYYNEFDLCSIEGHYKFPRKIMSNKQNEPAEIIYTDEKVNCKSRIEISKLKNKEFLYSYDLNLLDGYNIAKVQGFDAMLPKSINRLQGNIIYSPTNSNIVLEEHQNDKLVEKETVDIELY